MLVYILLCLLSGFRYEYTIVGRYYGGVRNILVGISDSGRLSCTSTNSVFTTNRDFWHQFMWSGGGNRYYHQNVQETYCYGRWVAVWVVMGNVKFIFTSSMKMQWYYSNDVPKISWFISVFFVAQLVYTSSSLTAMSAGIRQLKYRDTSGEDTERVNDIYLIFS